MAAVAGSSAVEKPVAMSGPGGGAAGDGPDENLLAVETASKAGGAALVACIESKMGSQEAVIAGLEALEQTVGDNDAEEEAAMKADAVKTLESALRLYQWNSTVQSRAFRLIAKLSGGFATELGTAGIVEQVVRGIRSNPDDHQAATDGVKCLERLTGTYGSTDGDAPKGTRDNLLRAFAADAAEVLTGIVEQHAQDTMLAFRAGQVLEAIRGLSEADQAAAAALVAKKKTWGMLRGAVKAGKAKEIALGNIPGKHGVSAQVAEVMKEGPKALITFMLERSRSQEVLLWTLDAFSTMLTGDEDACKEFVDSGGIGKTVFAMQRHSWVPEIQARGLTALTALSSAYPAKLAEEGACEAVCLGMTRCDGDYQVQTRGTQLLLSLCKNEECLARVKAAGGVGIVRSALARLIEDGQMQWRGIELLKVLQPELAAHVQRLVVQRSASKAMIRTASKIMRDEGLTKEEAAAKAAKELAALRDIVENAVIVEDDEDDEDDEE